MRHVPRFKRGLLLLDPNKQGSNHSASTRKQHTKHRRDTSTETEKPTRFQREHIRRTNNGRPRSTLTDRENGGDNNQFTHPKVQSPHVTTEPSSRLRTPIKTYRTTRSLTTHHDAQAPQATTEPSSFTAEPSKPSGPLPARQAKIGQHQPEKPR